MIQIPARMAKSSSGATRRSADTELPRIRWHAVKFVFPLVALFIVSALAFKGVEWVASIPAGEVMVTGYSGTADSAQGVTPEHVQALISDDLMQGFWAIDLNTMKRQLESIPWVRQANIRRVWPNQLSIGIDEHVVVARWNYTHLLTSSGELISPDDASEFSHLPHFVIEASLLEAVDIYAPESQRQVFKRSIGGAGSATIASNKLEPVLAHRVVSVRDMIERFNGLQKPLLDRDLAIEQFLMNASGDLSLRLSSGVRIELGRQYVAQRFTRFLEVYDQALANQFDIVKAVDLRYSNGASVQWRGKKISG